MPPSQSPPDWRARWLPVLFWIGVGLAPTAAVVLLVGQGGGPLRIAAVLAIFCVTLIGLSVALRNDVDQIRTEIESTVLDEVDAIRDETREDIVAVARKLHSALRREVAELEDEVAGLRRHLSESDNPGPASDFGRGVVRRTETYQVTRQTTVSSDDSRSDRAYAAAGVASGRARASRPAPSHPAPGRSTTSGTPASWSEPTRQYVDPGRAAAQRRAWDPLSDDLAERPGDGGAAYRPMAAEPPTNGGRRRAAEPDAPVPIAEIEAARPVDPWADLRDDTQPATARFGASDGDRREPVRTRAAAPRASARPDAWPDEPTRASVRGDAWRDEPTRDDARGGDRWSDEPTIDEPGPLDPGWRGSNSPSTSSPYRSW
jgi:hypothetical protein